VLGPRWFSVAPWLGAFVLSGQLLAFGQRNLLTADQVIAKYQEAIGGSDRFSSVMTFAEKGDVTGNLTNFVPAFHPPTLRKQQGIFEFYFKSPNRRLGVLRIEDKVVGMYGCDGKVAWYFNNYAGWREFKPKPGNEYACENGYEPLPLQRQKQNARIQLKGTKKVAGQMALAVQIHSSESPWDETFYFDAQTYLLIGWKSGGRFSLERFYSDYHDVGGVKLPFKVVQRTETSETVTTLREVKINSQVDDALFERSTALGQPRNPSAVNSPIPSLHEGLTDSSGKLPEINTGQNAVYVNAKSFVDCPIAELQEIVPELRGLQSSQSQEGLNGLLDKIGSKTVDLFQRVPNLISQEEVVESLGSRKALRKKFSYLILSHRSKDAVTLEEYRVDLQSNQPQPDNALDKETSPSQHTGTGSAQASPLAHGFAYMWVLFYPSNRAESTFRYLGRQKINRRNTLVVAFSQKTGSVRSPGEVRVEGKSIPILHQGVAWVDASDFRIVRLRTDLTSPLPDIQLRSLTAEVQFEETQVAGVTSSLWLPREVVVISDVNGLTSRDRHAYSNYRAYGVKTRLLLAP
jgi:hypothetical protein